FDDADDGVLHSMLFHSDTELAFGCVYNTCYGWGNLYCTNSSSAFQQKEFWSYLFDTENKSGDLSNWQLGKAQAYSKDRMAPTINWDYSYGTWRAIIQGCLLFADPAQTIRTPHPSLPPAQPSKPAGISNGIWHQEYFFSSSTTEPDGDQMFYSFNWGDGTSSGWLGPYTSGQMVTASHIWEELGVFDVKVKARDTWGAGSLWSEPLVVTITDNNAPTTPTITGPAEGEPGNQYLYNIQSSDADNHDISYFIDWGDDTTSGWLGPYVSGTMIHVTHSWDEQGTYTVKVKAKDAFDLESAWGELEVSMPLGVHLGQSNQLLPILLFTRS
ncbi:MAG: cadherin repeat domain-containing protein, partial [Candidatus Thermoplasmatota archaeon]|nr:cadherin repeat domain-containing protein [Candidatus Thermoplasmatota archaeon]